MNSAYAKGSPHVRGADRERLKKFDERPCTENDRSARRPRRLAMPRQADGRSLSEPLVVSIDLDDIELS